MKKLLQSIMVWFLPLIIIGGLFFPILGYIVLFMMIFFITLSYFKGRFWCSHLCPRGAFLDLVLSKWSLKKKLPRIFTDRRFKWAVFGIFMIIFVLQFLLDLKDIFSLGFVFVRMCLITTLIAIFLGLPLRERVWCAICPMGTLQTSINLLRKRLERKRF